MNIESIIDVIKTLHALRGKFKSTTYVWDKEKGYRMEIKLSTLEDRHLATFDLRSDTDVDHMYEWISSYINK